MTTDSVSSDPRTAFAAFMQLEGETLTVSDDKGTQQSLLISQVNHSQLPNSRFESLSVVLQGDESLAFEQGVYYLEHASTGKQPLLCVPLGNGSYEVIFSREREPVATP